MKGAELLKCTDHLTKSLYFDVYFLALESCIDLDLMRANLESINFTESDEYFVVR